ncbi:Endonuclease 4 [Mycoplasmoides pneumoniae]|uniref:Probable endonuclease 4 n=1 Tax=Mycoplasmoides pneumoniae TaxID=2104 RepID=A0AB38W8M1_MYCPM|nr:Endonuclease 4 [Mycoplasmoides pneumoniae]
MGSVRDAVSIKAQAFMIFLGAPHTALRVDPNRMQIDEGHTLMEQHNLSKSGMVVHAPYIINCASKDPVKQTFAIDVLTREVKLCHAVGAKLIVLHPGSAVEQTQTQALDHLIKVLNTVIANTKEVIICLETMAGKGNEIGRDLDQLKYVINHIEQQERIGVCLDTCHFHDSGNDFNNTAEIMETIDTKLGFEFLKVIHLNESKNVCGSKKDRHANLGEGMIGFDNLMRFIAQPQIKQIPIVLETPSDKHNYPAVYGAEIERIRAWFGAR